MQSEWALRVEGLSKSYRQSAGKKPLSALQDVNLQVPQGDFFGLLGPNGAGKTTFLSVLTSLVRKTSGKVWIHGVDIDQDFPQARGFLGVVPQEFNFYQWDKLEDILYYQAGFYGIGRRQARPTVEYVLKKLSLWDKRHEMARRLSGGMKRRLMIARAMVAKPRILILDEPSAGVDVEIRHTMWEFLRELNAGGTTIILTSHYLEEIEQLCRHVAILQKGNVLRDTKVADLIAELSQEFFILDTEQAIDKEMIKPLGAHYTMLDAHRLRVALQKGEHLNTVFARLSEMGLQVSSMRGESNRLEAFFLSLTQ